jgi:hypothetical protein
MAMPPKSLGVSTSRDWYHKLVWESNRLDSLRNDGGYEFAYSFINAALTAWHMADWAHAEFGDEGKAKFPQVRHLHAYLQTVSGYLAICREVADGSKHAVLQKYDPDIGTSRVVVQLDGDSEIREWVMWCIDDGAVKHQPQQVIRSALYFWTGFLSSDMKFLGTPGSGLTE